MGFHGVYARRPKTLPRRPKTPQRRSQDAPRRPMAAQEGLKTPPRRPQDAPRRRQERKIRGSIWDRKAISSGIPSRPRFWSVLGSILGGFGIDFGGCRGGFFLGFWGVFNCFGRVSRALFFTKQHEAPDMTRDNRTLTTNKRASRSPIKTGLCWEVFSAQDASKTALKI